MNNTTQVDLSREEIIARYRQRIQKGDHTKLSKQELEQLALHFVDRLKSINSQAEIQALCEAEIALLQEGYPQATIAGNQLPLYRQLIKDAIKTGTLLLSHENSHVVTWTKRNTGELGQTQEHFALHYLKYDQATYQQIRGEGTAANNSRQDNLQRLPLQRYLDTAVELLASNDERQLAIAIAALTGRRHTEVISRGQFQPTHHPYLLHFQGQQKKQINEGETAPAFDILTLVPATQVLEGIERFRALPAIRQLEGADSKEPKMRVLNTRIDREVKHLFQDSGIVPVLAGKKTVSIHRLRGVYGAIAIHFFCPPTKHEHRFLQHYLGHVLDQQQTAPNSIATSHYFHYRLVDEQGQPLEGQGVLLGARGLPPLNQDEVQLEPAQPVPQEESIAPLDSVEPIESAAQTQALQVETEQTKVTSKTWANTTKSQTEQAIAVSNDSTKSAPTPPPRPHSLLRIFKDEHDRWLAVLNAFCSQCNNQQEKTSALLQWIEARLDGSTDTPVSASGEADSGADRTTPQSTPELVEAKSDPSKAAEQTAQHHPTAPVITQVVVDQARTLSWLTGRIEALEAEINTLKQQRDEASATSTLSHTLQQELERFKTENRELKQAAARFEAARAALLGDDSNPTPATTTTQARSADSTPGSKSAVQNQDLVQDQTQQQQVQDTTSTAPTQILGAATPKLARSGGAQERAQRIFAAICEWNQQHPQDTWAITVGLLEETFGINRKAAKEFISVNQNLIEEHHAQIGVENQRGHNRAKDSAALKAFVQQLEA